jgi:membrane-associated phospholipid phosphatase
VKGATGARLRDAASVVLAWAVILAAVLGVGWLLTSALSSSVEPWDDDAARWFAEQRNGDLTQAAEAVTFLGETPVGTAAAAVAAVLISFWQRSVRPALFLAVVVAGIGGFYGVATVLLSRRRPPVAILDPGLVPNDSYPSGHVGTAIAAYGGTALLLWWLAPRARPWIWLLALVPVFVALARLYEGAHHVTDVLASSCYASAWLAVVGTVFYRRSGRARGGKSGMASADPGRDDGSGRGA